MTNPKTGSGENTPEPYQQTPVEKTFVEGSESAPASPKAPASTNPGNRVNATQISATNPYSNRQPQQADLLPSGDEPVILGSGTIAGSLGTGGMARVYKIWNEKLEVFRAVKIIIPGQGGDLRSRFETEAKITAKLHHPNIVEIYSVGEFNGLPYIEMELIDGESLEAIIARYGKLADPVAAAIGIFIAEALVYAHSHEFLLYGKTYNGVIHRDLKPANIMISKDGRVKLMDFGIARPTETSLHTVDGNIVGTMQYLSPEQLDGIDIDNRTDLYSLGAILYELLTGTKTFPQNTITNLMRKKIANEYRKFSEFDFNVSPLMAKITQKCLQFSKEQRYADADELLKELNTAFRALVTQTPAQTIKAFLQNPEGNRFTAKRPPPLWLNKWSFIGAAVVVVVALVFIVFMATGPESAQKISSVTPTAIQQPNPPPVPQTRQSGGELKPLNPAVVPVQPDENPSSEQNGLKTRDPERPPVKTIEPKRSIPYPSTSAKPVKQERAADQLAAKYKKTDPFEIGKAAMAVRAYSDAIIAFEKTPATGPNAALRSVLLLEALVETGRIAEAAALIPQASISDAQFDVLAGRVYAAQGKNKLALDKFQSAITRPSIVRSVVQIRKDALYYTAAVRGDHFHISPTTETKSAAIGAWTAVLKIYTDESSSARYRQAAEEIAKLQ